MADDGVVAVDLVTVVHDFVPAVGRKHELALQRGDEVSVLAKHPSGWWHGEVNQRSGLFPVTCTSAGGGAPPMVPPRSGAHYVSFVFAAMPPTASPKKMVIVRKPQQQRVMPSAPAPTPPPLGRDSDSAARPKLMPSAPAPAPPRDSGAQPQHPPPVVAVPVSGPRLAVVAAGAPPQPSKGTADAPSAVPAAVTPLSKKLSDHMEAEDQKMLAALAASSTRKGSVPVATVAASGSGGTLSRNASVTVPSLGGSGTVPAANVAGKKAADKRPPKSIRGFFGGKNALTHAGDEEAGKSGSVPTTAATGSSSAQPDAMPTRSQSMAAEKFKTRVAHIYDRNLASVRQVFDGLSGADEGGTGTAASADDALDIELDMDEAETITSRAALDLSTSSPKVFRQVSDRKSDRLRMLRELSTAERQAARSLDTQREAPTQTVAHRKPSAVSMVPTTRKRSETNAPSAQLAASPVARKLLMDALDVGAASPSEPRSPSGPEPEEVRRLQHFSFSHTNEWLESHSMNGRVWVAGSNKVPDYKQASWALVDVREGEFFIETGKQPPCENVADFGEIYRLEDVAMYRFWMRDFYLNSRHVYFLCQPGGSAEAAEPERKPGLFSRMTGSSSAIRLDGDAAAAAALSASSSAGDVVLVVVRMGDEDKGDPSFVSAFHKKGIARVLCPHSGTKAVEAFLRKAALLKALSVQGVRPFVNAPLDKHMLAWERGIVQRAFKFGVLYARNGQIDEDDIYSNEHGSDAFREFLVLLGNIVPLKGHEGYRAGLNVQNNSTGFLSVYNVVTVNDDGEMLWDMTSHPSEADTHTHTLKMSIEVMFHVSTFLPFSPENRQQLHRKRHIGNDVCVIIFKERSNAGLDETGKPKEPNLPLPVRVFQSQFNHVFIVVTPWRFDARGKTTHYKVVVACKDGVRPHRPYLPKNGIISVRRFTHWILMKCINGERAAMYAKSFSGKEGRTNVAMLSEALTISSARGASGSQKSRPK